MTRQQIKYTKNFAYWYALHRQKENRRIEALKRNEIAPYGYFQDNFKPEPIEQNKGDTQIDKNNIKYYKLEITYKQANQLINEGATVINTILKIGSQYYLTEKNALTIPRFTFIKDIDNNYCLYTGNKFIKII